ncbi:hypothetical protein BDV12DRAFT_201546 [Aspergillus spectabilis]
MESEAADKDKFDYNEVLIQISTNLTNALKTYGPSSTQYQTVLEMLKDCLQDIDRSKNREAQSLDPDTLSIAMGFLEFGK